MAAKVTMTVSSDSWPVSSPRSSLPQSNVLEGEVTLSSDYVALVTGDKRGGRRRRGWSAWEVAPTCLFPFMLVKCICAGVVVTAAMCVPATGVR